MILRRFLMNAYYLRGASRVHGRDLFLRFYTLAADDQVIFTAQLPAHFLDSGTHLSGVLFFAEVGQRFVDEWAFMKARLRTRGSFQCCHNLHLGRISRNSGTATETMILALETQRN